MRAMPDFTRDTWTIEDTDRKGERLRRVRDEELLEHLASAVFMCQPDASGRPPRKCHVIQRELVRLEICSRGAGIVSYASSFGR